MTGSTAIRSSLIAVLILLPLAYCSQLWLTFLWAAAGAQYNWKVTGERMVGSGIGIFIAELMFLVALIAYTKTDAAMQMEASAHMKTTPEAPSPNVQLSLRHHEQSLLVSTALGCLIGGLLALLFLKRRDDR